jgi:hypothetical protein
MRFVVWTGVEEWLTEVASVDLQGNGLVASGIQLGADPVPYRVDYRLDASDGFVTRELDLTATGEGWRRRLLLRHDGSGGWSADTSYQGDVPGDPWDGELPDLSEALDIDIEFSPLTNSMPILRHRMDREGERDFLMAFVTMPLLRVQASPQRYEHVSGGDERSIVRFLSRDGDFTAELELDPDGLLLFYPRLARRVGAGEFAAGAQ